MQALFCDLTYRNILRQIYYWALPSAQMTLSKVNKHCRSAFFEYKDNVPSERYHGEIIHDDGSIAQWIDGVMHGPLIMHRTGMFICSLRIDGADIGIYRTHDPRGKLHSISDRTGLIVEVQTDHLDAGTIINGEYSGPLRVDGRYYYYIDEDNVRVLTTEERLSFKKKIEILLRVADYDPYEYYDISDVLFC